MYVPTARIILATKIIVFAPSRYWRHYIETMCTAFSNEEHCEKKRISKRIREERMDHNLERNGKGLSTENECRVHLFYFNIINVLL